MGERDTWLEKVKEKKPMKLFEALRSVLRKVYHGGSVKELTQSFRMKRLEDLR